MKRVIILSNYVQSRNIKIFKDTHDLNIPVFNMRSEMNIPVENRNVPFFFTIEQDFKCRNFQMAIKEAPEVVEAYLKAAIK